MSERPSVSVVIVSWNARRYLAQCLESLVAAPSDCPMEVLVVDNASEDGSAELVERDYPQFRVIRTGSNLGFARGNNIGIKAGSAKYIALVNSDVKVLANCLDHLVEYCEAHPDVGMVGPRVLGADGKLQRSCRGFPSLWNMFCRALALDTLFPKWKLVTGYELSHWAQDTERTVDMLSGCFWLVRRQALERVGLLDEKFFMYGEDMDWCRRFWDSGWKVVFVPSAEAIHYGGGSSANAPVRFYIEKQRADVQYWRKHHCDLAVRCFVVVSCLHLVLRMIGYCLALLVGRGAREVCRYKMKRSVACLWWMITGRAPAV
jgi:GT2 family glycosyltransferase